MNVLFFVFVLCSLFLFRFKSSNFHPQKSQSCKMLSFCQAIGNSRFPRRSTSDSSICAICWEPLRKKQQLHCGHIFCKKCIRDFLNHHKKKVKSLSSPASCPMCRRPIQKETLQTFLTRLLHKDTLRKPLNTLDG